VNSQNKFVKGCLLDKVRLLNYLKIVYIPLIIYLTKKFLIKDNFIEINKIKCKSKT